MNIAARLSVGLIASIAATMAAGSVAVAQQQMPNIVVIMGDDIGWFNVGAYHQGIMAGRTPSARNEIFYFTEGTLSAVRLGDYKYRFTDQPQGWLGATVKVDWPILTNLRLDPFERTGLPTSTNGSLAYYNWFAYEFWRFVFVQREVGKLAQTAIDFPPMQQGASFNLAAVKAQIDQAIAARAAK
ncbi:C-terminal region of aryl-sulfatase [Rhodospirillales bacterium URHD0017]|nr:C-terminal region of aryl-sulfatase [Rhodospirillales bacterium URHD0017]